MQETRDWFRRAFDDFYLMIYANRDGDEAEQISDWLAPLVRVRENRVLDLACGAARFFEPLRRAGSRYVGLDLSPRLLEEASRLRDDESRSPDLLRADMRSIPIRDATADVVISMFTSFGYFATPEEEIGVLEEIARVLAPGGRFAVDLMNPDHLRRTLVPVGERDGGGLRIEERRSIQDDTVVKDIRVLSDSGATVREYHERVRLIPLDTLASWCASVGLAHRWTRGDYAGTPYDATTSPRLIAGFEREGA